MTIYLRRQTQPDNKRIFNAYERIVVFTFKLKNKLMFHNV